MKKKSIVMLATGIVLAASLVIGGTLAFFTDSKSATNTFTVGKGVEITVTETPVDPNTGKKVSGDPVTENRYENVSPAQPLDKDPVITNTGSDAVYARMKVSFTNGQAWLDATAKHNTTPYSVFGTLGEGWTCTNPDNKTLDGTNLTYLFTYNTTIAAGTPSPALFETVTIPGAFTAKDLAAVTADSSFQLLITGEAIQATGFEDSEGAFAAIDDALVANAENTPTP